jgi:hypothetical protein
MLLTGGGRAQARRAVRAAEVDASPVAGGEAVRLAGLSAECRLLHRASLVLNGCSAVNIRPIDVPRFRAVHEEARLLGRRLAAGGRLLARAGRGTAPASAPRAPAPCAGALGKSWGA